MDSELQELVSGLSFEQRLIFAMKLLSWLHQLQDDLLAELARSDALLLAAAAFLG